MRARACVKRWRASMSVYLFLSFRYYTHKVQGVRSHCGGVGLKSFRTFVIVKRGMGTFLPMKCFGSCVDRFDLHHIRPEISGLGPLLKYGAEVVILWAGRPSRLLLLLLFAKIGKLALSLFRSFVSFPVISPSEIRN